MTRQSLRARRVRRAALSALIAATATCSVFDFGGRAYANTYSFTVDLADMLDPSAWTPNGIPGASDLMFIGRRPAGDLTNTDITLNGGSIDLGAIFDHTSRVRTIYNTANANSMLTIHGLPGMPLIAMDTADANTVFKIQQANGGSGTGTLALVFTSSGDLQTTASGTLSLAADIADFSGPLSFRKTGTGTLNLGGNNSFSGSLEAHQGQTWFDMAANPGQKIASTGSLIFTGGTVTQVGNATQDVTQTVNGAYINSGQSVIAVNVSGAGQMSSTLNVGAFHRSTGGYLNINYTLNGTNPNSIPRVVATNTNTNGIIGAWLTVGNNDWAVNDGSNNIIPMPAGSYAAKDSPSTWSTNDNITNSTAFSGTLPASLTINSLRFNTTGAQTVGITSGQTLTIGSGGILVTSGAGTGTISGGNLTSGNNELLAVIGGSKTLTISSSISNNGATPLILTKAGSGTLVLTGASTYTGGIIFDTGTINAMAIQPAGTPSSLGADGLISMGGPNNTLLVGSTSFAGSLNFNRNFQFNEGTQTLQINAVTGGATVALNGTVTGTGGVTKGGSATSALVVPGAKTFSGAVTSNSGMISVDTIAPIGTPSGLGTGTLDPNVTIGSGNGAGTLEFTGTADSTTDRTLSLGNTNLPNGGSINLVSTKPNTTLTWNGNMSFLSGQPSVVNGSSITFATGPNNVRPFLLSAAGTIVFNGSIGTGTAVYGQLQKTGAGTVILGGQNGYAIGTTVNSGTLITMTNFSNGTITQVGTTAVIGLSLPVSGTFARVAEKPTANDATGTTVLPSLSMTGGATLDLTNNALVLTNISQLPYVQGALHTGYNSGSWNGGGIESTTAAAQAGSAHKTALGYAQASAIFSSFPATFAGATIDADSVLVAYTYSGDANLDGTVDTLDFNALAGNFGGTGKTWSQADFNYDGVVDTLDFNNLAANFGQHLAGTSGGGSSIGALVPEPGCIGMMMLSLCGFAARRRRAC